MKVIDINHLRYMTDDAVLRDGLPDNVTHLKVQGAGVVIILIHRPGEGIDITVNPTGEGEDYMHNVKVHEVAVSSSQVRISRAQGSPL